MDVPISAYLFCYFPLATVVIGLLAFFYWTDAHARRPYLRFNPFIAQNMSAADIEARPPQTGPTPAGSLGSTTGEATVFMGQMQAIGPADPNQAPRMSERDQIAPDDPIDAPQITGPSPEITGNKEEPPA